MPWTARCESKYPDTGQFSVVYVNGENKILRDYTVSLLTDDAIIATVRQEVERFETIVAEKAASNINPGDAIDFSGAAGQEITPEQQAQTEWMLNYRKLQGLLRAKDMGLVDVNDKKISDLVAALRPTLLDIYLDLL